MIQSLITLITALIPTTATVITLTFLPVIIELKRPKDAGPRLITDSSAQIRLSTLKTALLNI